MKKTNWLVVVLVGLLALFVLFGAGATIGNWGYGGYGMMSGPGMMGWGYSPFGWFGMGLGMLFMWLIPIGFLAITVLGITWLVKNVGNSRLSSSPNPCPNCGKGVQADWQNCPYCGTVLK
jgi:hypothetical protein